MHTSLQNQHQLASCHAIFIFSIQSMTLLIIIIAVCGQRWRIGPPPPSYRPAGQENFAQVSLVIKKKGAAVHHLCFKIAPLDTCHSKEKKKKKGSALFSCTGCYRKGNIVLNIVSFSSSKKPLMQEHCAGCALDTRPEVLWRWSWPGLYLRA